MITDRLKKTYELAGPPTSHLEGEVQRFYLAHNFEPAWLSKEGWTANAQAALEALQHAEEEGLEAHDYQDAIQKMMLYQASIEAAYEADIALTKAMLRYIKDIKGGRLDPHTIDNDIYVKAEPVNAVTVLHKGLHSLGSQWLQDLAPLHPQYHALKQLLATYRALPPDYFDSSLRLESKLALGDVNPMVGGLRQCLKRRGFLHTEEAPNEEYLFDTTLESAVKVFQAHHGLNDDGIVGRETLKLLNFTVEDHIKQIIVTMERWRWMPKDLGSRYIHINIARFELEAVADGKVQLRSPIIVGLRYRETPQFTAPMTEITFNPTWHVPHRIALEEKLPKIRKDPSYLYKNNYVLYAVRAGERESVDPHNVDWNALSRDRFPYLLHQLPGLNNALGKIRFTLLNPFDIYLHSTPQPRLFDRPSRAYSHGCIRVKEHVALAEFALNNPKKWPVSHIEEMLENPVTRRVSLPRPIPVHIAYFTVGFNEKQEPYFMNDVYGQDARIWQALEERAGRSSRMASAEGH